MVRPKASRLLEWLLEGHPATLPGIAMPLEVGEKEDGTPVVGFRMTRQTPGSDEPPEEIIMDADITLNEFLAIAHKMSDDDLFIMGAGIALTDMARERSEQREEWVRTHRKA